MAIWSTEIKELEKLYESFKGQVPELEKELAQLIHSDDPNVIMLYSRRCLEVIITDLCECELKRPRKTEPLKGIIDKLHKEEKIPSHIIASMHGLNELSTYGAHPKEFDPEQIKPVLNNLDIIIKWYLKHKNIFAIGKIEGQEEKVVLIDDLFKEEKKAVGKEVHEKPDKLRKNQVFLNSIFILVVLAIAVTFLYPKIFKRDTLAKLRSSGERISVAVMPFQNMTNDTVWNIWQDGIQDMLITSLSDNPEELSVRQIESVKTLIQDQGITNYASLTPSIAGTISQKLDASVFIYGSIKRAGSMIRVYAQLIDSKTEEVFKSFQIEGAAKEENIFMVIDSLSVMVNDFLIISKLIKGGNPAVVKLQATTKYPEAFKCVISGDNAFFAKKDYSTAISMYLQAIAIDSNYLYPAIMISYCYWNQSLYEEGKKWCQKVYEKKDQMPLTIKTSANVIHAMYYETPYESIKYLRQLLEIDDQLPDVYTDIGFDYNRLGQYSRAIPELEKALEIYEKWGIKPLWSVNYTNLLLSYYKMGQYKKAKTLIKKADKDFPDDLYLTYAHAIFSYVESDTVTANQYIEKFIALGKDYSLPEAGTMNRVAEIYSEAGNLNKAEEYYRKSLSVLPQSPSLMNNLAYFLIDKDRNLDEGMQLVSKGLELNPDNYGFLHTKGWGLYNQGKYQEALEILQKSWDIRREKAIYDHKAFLHLEAAKKAVSTQKNN